MVFTLEIQSGQQAGRAIEIQPGQVIQVGRESPADLIIPNDPTLSDIHFLLKGGETSCYLCDLSTHGGIFVNGAWVTQAILHPGDRIDAGRTTFLLRTAAVTPQPVPAAAEPPRRDLRQRCRTPGSTPTPCGRCVQRPCRCSPCWMPRATRWCWPCCSRPRSASQSLYEGIEGERLAAAAPYLVELSKESPLLETLARDAWGRSWGVYLTCDQPFEAVRKHLRRFLLVTDEEGEELYFRYYDPRVLRIYLPTCTPEEAREFFGPFREFLMEGEDPTSLLIFSREGQATTPVEVPLAAVPGSVP